MDDWMESEYEERYEGEDYNNWEEQQVFLDREGKDDDTDTDEGVDMRRIENLLHRNIEPGAVVLEVKGDQFGLVLYTCPGHTGGPFRFIVHRFAFLDTAGEPIANGGMLYSGGYHLTLAEAQADFNSRSAL